MYGKHAWLIAGALAASADARDDDSTGQPLVTDRPDFTESTDAVPTGLFQLEAGYTFAHDREGRVRDHTHTSLELLLRAGLAHDFELRIGWEGYARTRTLSLDEEGDHLKSWTDAPADMIVGFKLKLADQEGWRPHLGIIVETTLPTGAGDESSGDVDPALKLLWAYDIDDRCSLAGNVNIAVPTENRSRFVQTSASISLAVAVNERWGAYAEYFGFYNNTHHSDAAHFLNGGITYLVTDDFQWDVRVGVGLNEEADDFFTGLGFAYRF